MKVKDYLEQMVVTGPVEQKMALDIRALTRWWLELARNTLVCSVLFTLAFKSKSLSIGLFATASVAALVTFIATYFNAYSLNLFPGVQSRWLNYILFSVGTAIFIAVTNIFVINSMTTFLLTLMSAQP